MPVAIMEDALRLHPEEQTKWKLGGSKGKQCRQQNRSKFTKGKISGLAYVNSEVYLPPSP